MIGWLRSYNLGDSEYDELIGKHLILELGMKIFSKISGDYLSHLLMEPFMKANRRDIII
jgi:hypothetical protein